MTSRSQPKSEVEQKMDQITGLSSAIDRARKDVLRKKSHQAALNLQDLIKRRDELRLTLPPLTVVKG